MSLHVFKGLAGFGLFKLTATRSSRVAKNKMPVPVSVTNPNGVGVLGAQLHNMNGGDLWSKFAKKAENHAETNNTQQQPQSCSQDVVQNGQHSNGQSAEVDATQPSIIVDGLTFAYPGLGASRWLVVWLTGSWAICLAAWAAYFWVDIKHMHTHIVIPGLCT